MRKLLVLLTLLISATNIALADDCRQRFIDIVIFSEERGYDGPTTSFITQQVNNAIVSKNYHYYVDRENWMTEMVEPAGAPWSLARNNVLYVSNDKGNSWQKVRELDVVKPADSKSDLQVARAESVRNTECLTEELDGEMLTTLHGEYDMLSSVEGSIDEKMWLSPDLSWVQKSETHLKMSGAESHTTQLIEKTPDLELPMPE